MAEQSAALLSFEHLESQREVDPLLDVQPRLPFPPGISQAPLGGAHPVLVDKHRVVEGLAGLRERLMQTWIRVMPMLQGVEQFPLQAR
ncbi:hypothetical protein D3C85_717910 [compost metagenome]